MGITARLHFHRHRLICLVLLGLIWIRVDCGMVTSVSLCDAFVAYGLLFDRDERRSILCLCRSPISSHHHYAVGTSLISLGIYPASGFLVLNFCRRRFVQ